MAREIAILRIGTILPLTGAQAQLAQDATQGADLAIADFTKANPEFIGKILVFKEDDRAVSALSKAAAETLFNKHRIDILITSFGSAPATAVVPIANSVQKPIVIPYSGRTDLTRMSPFAFRTSNTDSFQGELLARFAREYLQASTAAILEPSDSTKAKESADQFVAAFTQLGGQVAAREIYGETDKEFLQRLARVRLKKPQILLLPGYYEDAAAIMRLASETSLKVKIIGTDGWDSPELHEAAQASAGGHFYLMPFSPSDTNPIVTRFVTHYREVTNRLPSLQSAQAYDAFTVVLAAFKACQTNLPAPLTQALKNIRNLEVATGILSINLKRDAEKSAVIMETSARGPEFRLHLEGVTP